MVCAAGEARRVWGSIDPSKEELRALERDPRPLVRRSRGHGALHKSRAEGVVVGKEERAERFRLNGESARAGVRSAVTFSDITGSAIG